MKVLKITLATLFALIVCCPLFACDGIGGEKNTYELYLDYNTSQTDTYTFSIRCSESSYTNVDVDFDITIKNTTIKTLAFRFHRAKIVRESTGAEYSVGSFFGQGFEKITLESDLAEAEKFSSTIPTSYKTEKYRFEISLNKDRYIFYLYEKPDELREKHTVSYSVNGEIVRQIDTPDKRLYNLDSYVDNTNIYGCGKWYYDEACTQEVSFDDRVNKATTLYGKKESILIYKQFNPYADTLAVEGVNFIPSNGEIYIPKEFEGKQADAVFSSAFISFKDELKGIYMPKGVTAYGDLNYYSNLKTIYYEGTEEDWKSCSYLDIPSGVEIIYNTYK